MDFTATITSDHALRQWRQALLTLAKFHESVYFVVSAESLSVVTQTASRAAATMATFAADSFFHTYHYSISPANSVVLNARGLGRVTREDILTTFGIDSRSLASLFSAKVWDGDPVSSCRVSIKGVQGIHRLRKSVVVRPKILQGPASSRAPFSQGGATSTQVHVTYRQAGTKRRRPAAAAARGHGRSGAPTSSAAFARHLASSSAAAAAAGSEVLQHSDTDVFFGMELKRASGVSLIVRNKCTVDRDLTVRLDAVYDKLARVWERPPTDDVVLEGPVEDGGTRALARIEVRSRDMHRFFGALDHRAEDFKLETTERYFKVYGIKEPKVDSKKELLDHAIRSSVNITLADLVYDYNVPANFSVKMPFAHTFSFVHFANWLAAAYSTDAQDGYGDLDPDLSDEICMLAIQVDASGRWTRFEVLSDPEPSGEQEEEGVAGPTQPSFRAVMEIASMVGRRVRHSHSAAEAALATDSVMDNDAAADDVLGLFSRSRRLVASAMRERAAASANIYVETGAARQREAAQQEEDLRNEQDYYTELEVQQREREREALEQLEQQVMPGGRRLRGRPTEELDNLRQHELRHADRTAAEAASSNDTRRRLVEEDQPPPQPSAVAPAASTPAALSTAPPAAEGQLDELMRLVQLKKSAAEARGAGASAQALEERRRREQQARERERVRAHDAERERELARQHAARGGVSSTTTSRDDDDEDEDDEYLHPAVRIKQEQGAENERLQMLRPPSSRQQFHMSSVGPPLASLASDASVVMLGSREPSHFASARASAVATVAVPAAAVAAGTGSTDAIAITLSSRASQGSTDRGSSSSPEMEIVDARVSARGDAVPDLQHGLQPRARDTSVATVGWDLSNAYEEEDEDEEDEDEEEDAGGRRRAEESEATYGAGGLHRVREVGPTQAPRFRGLFD